VAIRIAVQGAPAVRAKVSSSPLPAVGRHARLAIAQEIGDEERAEAPSAKPEPAPPRVDVTVARAEASSTKSAAKSDERWRTLFDLCPAPAVVYDLATLQILAANEAMEQLYLFSREELAKMTILELLAPSDVDLVRSIVDEVRRGQWRGVLHHAQTIRHRRKDGEELDAELIAAPVTYGGLSARLVVHKDVTETKRAEHDLVKRARVDAFRGDIGAAMTADEPLPAHFARVVEAMEHHLDLGSAGIWALDEATGQLGLLASVGSLDATTAGGSTLSFGETWIGRAASLAAPVLADMWDPSMTDVEVAHAQAAGVTHVAALPLVVRRRVLGVVTAARSSAFPDELVEILRATATQIAQALGTAFAYEALRISESLSRSILENMPAALVTLDQDGVIETTNAAAMATFGYLDRDLVGLPFSALFVGREATPRMLQAQARGRGVTEWQGLRKGGERFPCELRLFQIDSLRGDGYAAILNDVSERYEIERLKAEFVSVVSHELRTPLTALRGSIGLLRGGVLGPLPEDVMELLHIAERNSLRLVTLVNDILDLERLHKGKMELFIEPVHARTIVDRSLDSVKPFADQASIAITVHCTDEVVLGDGDRLVQVLVNLLTNAVKFSPLGSRVEVITSVERDAVVFRVVDQGRGIPASHRRIIFERFEQVYVADGREKGGTGLGLAISKAIVEQHDGAIGVDSQEGHGSTFWFRVPRALAARGSVPPPSS
jgi:PAS domain S-box-containing protein